MTFPMSQPPKATLAEQINTTGFRRWHEYELTRSFGYLGLGVLTLFVALAMLEGVFAAPVRLEGGIRLILSFVCLCNGLGLAEIYENSGGRRKYQSAGGL